MRYIVDKEKRKLQRFIENASINDECNFMISLVLAFSLPHILYNNFLMHLCEINRMQKYFSKYFIDLFRLLFICLKSLHFHGHTLAFFLNENILTD